ncbi:MAG: hypothetical protein WBI74_12575 [Caldicoprobacterales bacterium]|jgi:hypothetical protein|nr:DsrE family protein [Clostridiales bacterium]
MKKILFYGMTGEKMCFQHILMNALQLNTAGQEVKIIFEGASVKLVSIFEEENNPLYRKAKEAHLIVGICMACSKVLGVYEANLKSGLSMLDDMSGHAGMKKYVEDGYHIISM